MQELIIRCTKIFITGWKEGKELKFETINVSGVGTKMIKFRDLAVKVNDSIANEIIEIDDMLDFNINSHEAIRIVSIPNNKEMLLSIRDKNGKLGLGITFLCLKKIEFTDIGNLERKYS